MAASSTRVISASGTGSGPGGAGRGRCGSPRTARSRRSGIGHRDLHCNRGHFIRRSRQSPHRRDRPGRARMKTNFSRVMATMALRFRDNLALVNVERDRRYTYAEYHRLTNRIAHMMRHALGLGAGDTVLLILENDNLSLLHFPAIYKQAATFVFSNLRDSPEEQARQIDHVKPKLVFIETRLVASVPRHARRPRLPGGGDGSLARSATRRAVLLGPGGSGVRRGQRRRARRARAYRHPALHRRHHGAGQVRDVFDRPLHGDARQLLSHHRSRRTTRTRSIWRSRRCRTPA